MQTPPCPLPRRRPRAGRGFTLVEMLVAAVIFMVGMLGVFALQTSSASTARDSLDLSAATSLATSRLELLRVSQFDALASDKEYFDSAGASLGTGGLVPANTFYTVDWAVVNDSADLRDLAVTVTWTRARGHEVRLRTKRAR